MLYQLSYASLLERETGIEPATNSLEGCDSTTELLPLSLKPLDPSLKTHGISAAGSRFAYARKTPQVTPAQPAVSSQPSAISH